jgi:hypothetical protein
MAKEPKIKVNLVPEGAPVAEETPPSEAPVPQVVTRDVKNAPLTVAAPMAASAANLHKPKVKFERIQMMKNMASPQIGTFRFDQAFNVSSVKSGEVYSVPDYVASHLCCCRAAVRIL